jgi:tryptophan halogenase
LFSNLDSARLAAPRLLQFTSGCRKEAWTKNCVAVGLSSGFLEPLESTSIHMIQTAIMDLIKFFPATDFGPRVIEEYNRRAASRYECFRDFVILHYHATEREDSEFWRYCKNMSVPDSLLFNEEIFRRHGHITSIPPHGFGPRAWFTVMYSQGITPEACPPLAETLDDRAMRVELAKLRAGIKRAVEQMPSHEDFITSNCNAVAAAA